MGSYLGGINVALVNALRRILIAEGFLWPIPSPCVWFVMRSGSAHHGYWEGYFRLQHFGTQDAVSQRMNMACRNQTAFPFPGSDRNSLPGAPG